MNGHLAQLKMVFGTGLRFVKEEDQFGRKTAAEENGGGSPAPRLREEHGSTASSKVRHGIRESDTLRWYRSHRDWMAEHSARHFSKNQTE
jgi:hypothetical protein